MKGRREQVPFGVPCFKFRQYILGYTTAYKYIDTLYTNWRLQKIETGKKKKREDSKGQRRNGSSLESTKDWIEGE